MGISLQYLPEQSGVARQTSFIDIRFYVVWRTLRNASSPTDIAGLRCGCGNRGYRGILESNEDQFRGLRFQRCGHAGCRACNFSGASIPVACVH